MSGLRHLTDSVGHYNPVRGSKSSHRPHRMTKSLPLYWNAAGLPIGIQLVAAFGREDLLPQVAAQAEQARPWKDRRPPVCA
jgi:amidase